MKKVTINDLFMMKNREKIVMITAYDALFARLFDDYVDMILVGDSLNMSFGGKNETIGLSVDDMIYHTKAVQNGAKKAFLVVDMPFGSACTPQIALKNAIKIYKKTGCDAVKIEGTKEMADTIKLLSQNGIIVMSHIGLKPHMSRFEGGYKIKCKDELSAKSILEDAIGLESAGASLILLEGIVSSVASEISQKLKVPTIGIGSGASCDGQVLVWSDAFGFFDEFKPKFVKRYLEGATLIKNSLKEYADEVKNSKFPSSQYEYTK